MIILGKVRPLSGRLLGPHPQVLIIARRGPHADSTAAAPHDNPGSAVEGYRADPPSVDEGGRLDPDGDEGVTVTLRQRTPQHRLIKVEHSTSWSGPLPPASELQAFEFVVPGAAERILRMSENALAAEIDCDITLAHGDVAAVKRGQWLSTAVVVASTGTAVTLALLHAPWLVVGLFASPPMFQFATSLVRAIREPVRKPANDKPADDANPQENR